VIQDQPVPQQLTTEFDLARVRDLAGRATHVWYRRAVLAAMLAFVLVALFEGFGQGAHVRTASGPGAVVSVHIPHTVRGGLLVPVQIQVRAKQKLVSPQIVLGAGFARGAQVNTLEPSPTSETSRTAAPGELGPLALTYPTLEPGDQLTIYLQLQIDPTTIGKQDTSVSVEAANARPVRAPGTFTVLP
jgi:hypothetical protein